jgi:hypothetical protein
MPIHNGCHLVQAHLTLRAKLRGFGCGGVVHGGNLGRQDQVHGRWLTYNPNSNNLKNLST